MSRRLLLILAGLTAGSVTLVRGQEAPALLKAVTADAPRGGPGVKRSRIVTVEARSIDIAPRSAANGKLVEFNFFEDARFVADLVRMPGVKGAGDASVSWSGTLRDQPGSQVFFTNRDGIIAANVRTGDGRTFQLRYSGSGTNHVAQEVDQNTLPKDGPPKRVPQGDGPMGAAARGVADSVCADSDTIDVLVAYTPAVRKKNGGTAGVEALIDLALAETNQGYAASNVTQRIRIVHRAELDYDESAGFDQTLTDLTGKSDGKLDAVHALRDSHKADMVSLWIDHNEYCGLAWLMENASANFSDKAFSVVYTPCATGYYSFAHEMGHNQGATHDRQNSGGPGAYGHSYCFQNTASAPYFRTIMAYACGGVDCPRVNHWSNPAVPFNGIPTGIQDGDPNAADNHLTLEKTRTKAAQWRCSTPP
jgi:hypothetical protein